MKKIKADKRRYSNLPLIHLFFWFSEVEDEAIKDDFWRTLLLNLRDTIYGIIPNSLEDEIFIFVNMIFLNNNVPSY